MKKIKTKDRNGVKSATPKVKDSVKEPNDSESALAAAKDEIAYYKALSEELTRRNESLNEKVITQRNRITQLESELKLLQESNPSTKKLPTKESTKKNETDVIFGSIAGEENYQSSITVLQKPKEVKQIKKAFMEEKQPLGDKSIESMSITAEELNNVIKQDPFPSRFTNNNPACNYVVSPSSTANTVSNLNRDSNKDFERRSTFSVQTMSPNINMVDPNVLEEIAEDVVPPSPKEEDANNLELIEGMKGDFACSSNLLESSIKNVNILTEEDMFKSAQIDVRPHGRRCSQEKLIGVAKCLGAEQYLLKARTYPKDQNLKEKFKTVQNFKGDASEDFKYEVEQSLSHDIPVALPSQMARNSTKYGSPVKKENKRTQSNFDEPKPTNAPRNTNTMFSMSEQKHSKRLFEEFFVIGADVQSVESQKIKDFSIIPPKKLYQFPNLPENKNDERRKMVQEFCFPDGVKVSEIKLTESMSDAVSVICERSMNIMSENTFVFTMSGFNDENSIENENSRYLYCICLKCVDPLISTKESTIVAQKVFCFMTYNGFFEFFFYALSILRGVLKYDRLTIANKEISEANLALQVTKQIEAYIKVPIINDEGIRLLKKLYFEDVETNKAIAIDPAINLFYKYTIPDFYGLRKAKEHCFCPILFSSVDYHIFYEVLCSAFIERSIIFVSRNLNLLTSASMGICTLLSPLKWQHIFIPLLPSIYQEILDAPMPYIAGLNRSSEEKREILQNSGSALLVFLDTGELIQNDQQTLKKLPYLNNLQAKLVPFFKKISRQENVKGLKEPCYNAGDQEISATDSICKIIEDTINQLLTNHLPKSPPMVNGDIDLEQIKIGFIKIAKRDDQEFSKKLAETQLFASFIGNHYKEFIHQYR